MSALRVFLWTLAFMASLDTWMQTKEFRQALDQAITLRHTILSKDEKRGQKFCEAPSPYVRWHWREENLWTDVCPSFSGFSELPRYWKLTLLFKYQLLFSREIPITVSIVISA